MGHCAPLGDNMKNAYEQGYYANASGDLLEENPHSPTTQAIDYYAWAGGWNDCDIGYKLDLSVFGE